MQIPGMLVTYFAGLAKSPLKKIILETMIFAWPCQYKFMPTFKMLACSITRLTGESRFHISTLWGLNPGPSWREVNGWSTGPVERCVNKVRLQALHRRRYVIKARDVRINIIATWVLWILKIHKTDIFAWPRSYLCCSKPFNISIVSIVVIAANTSRKI